MRKLKSVTLHIIIFIFTLAFLWLMLVASACIPNDIIKENMEESALSYKTQPAFSYGGNGRMNAISDNYADAILLGVSWNMGIGNPVESSLDTKYNDGGEIGENAGLYLSVSENVPPNTDYTRYWHGSAMFIRPLHMLLNVNQIKNLGLVTVIILALTVGIILLRRKHYDLTLCFILSLAAVQIWNIRLSLEYQPAFIVGLLFCILFMLFERKSDTYLTYLSVISGIWIAFFDFLTVETVSILLPLILVITVRAKENRLGNFRECLVLITKCILCWGLAYAFTFIAKWSLASLVTGENMFIPALSSAGERFGGSLDSESITNPILQVILAPIANLTVLFGGSERIDIPRVLISLILVTMLIGSVMYMFGRKSSDKTVYKLLCIISAAVILRYLVLSNHSYLHEFFTYRALITPIMAILSGAAISCTSEKGARK